MNRYKKYRIISSFAFFIVCSPFLQLNAQFSKYDYDLVKTTYSREFDKNIIVDYITSPSPQKVIAALLSISHSNDVSFIPVIRNLEYDKYGDYIAFALGQLGHTPQSVNYLLKKIASPENSFIRQCYQAFGKIAEPEEMESLLSLWDNLLPPQTAGFTLAFAAFHQNGNTLDDERVYSILSNEIGSKNKQRQFEAFYTLYRLGGRVDLNSKIVELIEKNLNETDSFQIIQYALSCLRSTKIFPGDLSLVKELVNSPEWNIRCEASRSICYYKFENENDLQYLLKLLKDPNPNVTRQTAISIKEIKLNENNKVFLKNELKSILDKNNLTKNTRSELFVSLCSLFPDEIQSIINEYSGAVAKEYVYLVMTTNTTLPDYNFNYLVDNFVSANENDLLLITQALLALQAYNYTNENYISIVAGALNSNYPSVISVTADAIDSTFASRQKSMLESIIYQHIENHLNEIGYLDALQSLERLSAKISRSLNKKILHRLLQTKLYSLNFYAYNKLGETGNKPVKSIEDFDILWDNAFRYREAIVKTEKGNFTIKFNAEYSPISVGNFCKLAKENFFDDIVFHRVVPVFVIQTGDRSGTGWGGPGYEIASEFSPLPYQRGYVGMASSGKDTEGSQWFVMQANHPHLNGRYSNFGKIIKGFTVIDMIDQYDKIIDVQLTK